MTAHAHRSIEESPAGTPFDRLTRNSMAASFSKSALSKGERYWRDDHIETILIEEGGATITAQVWGSDIEPYELTIDLIEKPLGIGIDGICSCPVGFNCKHVAAALFAALSSREHGSFGIARANANATPVAGVGRRAKKSDAPRPEILAPELSTWVGQLAALEQSETEDYAPELRQRLIYVVSLNRQHFGAPHLAVQPTSVKLLKDDTFSVTVKPFNPGNVAQDSPAKFLRPSDRDILGKLTRMRHRVQADTGSLLAGEEGAAALKAMIATGRARWGSIHGAVVTQGPARRGRMAWRVNDDGWHQPAFELDEALDAEVIRLAPPLVRRSSHSHCRAGGDRLSAADRRRDSLRIAGLGATGDLVAV